MITSGDIIKLEELSIKHGVTKLMLMENAGYGVFMELKKIFDLANNKLLIVCGHGNNGGDGFAIAKYFNKENFRVNVLFIGTEEKLKKEAAYNYYFLKDLCPGIFVGCEIIRDLFIGFDIIIDCIFGTGIKGKINEPYSSVIDAINSSGKKIISVDVPSGLDPNKGIVHDKSIGADIIFALHDIKPGLSGLKAKVVIVDIGIPKEAVRELENSS